MRHVVFLLERDLGTLFIDRRVLNQARTFVRCGWAVTILLPTYGPEDIALAYEDGVRVRAFSQSKTPLEKTFISELTGIPNRLIGNSTALAAGFEPRLSQVAAGWPAPGLDRMVPFEFFDIDPVAYQKNSTHFSIFRLYMQTDYYCRHVPTLKPDLIWVADHHGCRAAWRLRRDHGIPYVLDFHEVHWGQDFKPVRERTIVHKVEAEACRSALAVTTVSELCAELLALDFGLARLPIVLNNVPAFAPVSFEAGRGRLAAQFGISERDRVVIFHGGLGARRRNIEPLLEAQAASAPEGLHLVFLGNGSAEPAIRDAGPRVLFHPMVDQQAMAEFVAGSDYVLFPYVGMVPNYRFSSGNKLFDAIVLRRPMIVTTELDDTCLTIEDHGIGWTTPMTGVADMTRWLARAATGPATWPGLAEGFARAETALGPAVTFGRLERLIADIERALGAGPPPARATIDGEPARPRRYRRILERRRDLALAAGRLGLAARIERFVADRLPGRTGPRRCREH